MINFICHLLVIIYIWIYLASPTPEKERAMSNPCSLGVIQWLISGRIDDTPKHYAIQMNYYNSYIDELIIRKITIAAPWRMRAVRYSGTPACWMRIGDRIDNNPITMFPEILQWVFCNKGKGYAYQRKCDEMIYYIWSFILPNLSLNQPTRIWAATTP